MSNAPQLFLFAGPNGAGKSTFIRGKDFAQLVGTPRPLMLNIDYSTRRILLSEGFSEPWDAPFEAQFEAFKKAAERVMQEAEEAIESKRRVCIETVLSTDKYLSLVQRTQALGGAFRLIYIALDSPELSKQRVRRRVEKDKGHPVPTDRLQSRWQKSLNNLVMFAQQSDSFYVFNNSDSDPRQKPSLMAWGAKNPGTNIFRGEFRGTFPIPAVTHKLSSMIEPIESA